VHVAILGPYDADLMGENRRELVGFTRMEAA